MQAASSVVGLLSTAANTSTLLNEFIKGSTNAPDIAIMADLEVHDFRVALSKLQPTISGTYPVNISRASLIEIEHLSLTLSGSMQTLSQLEVEVNKLTTSGRIGLVDRMKWPWLTGTVNGLIKQLRRHQSALTLILAILTAESPHDATNNQRRLSQHLSRGVPTNRRLWSVLGIIREPGSGQRSSDADLFRDTYGTIVERKRLYRLSIESVLYRSRPYRTISRTSTPSLLTSERQHQWPPFTLQSADSVPSLPLSYSSDTVGLSLAEVDNLASLPVPVTQNSLLNPTWYGPNAIQNLPSTQVLSPYEIIPKEPATPRTKQNPKLSLIKATSDGRLEDVIRLLAAGVPLEIVDKHGQRALHHAVIGGHERIVKFLLDQGADHRAIQKDSFTPMHLAAKLSHDVIAHHLLDTGADKEASACPEGTPLHLASGSGSELVTQLLLDRGGQLRG